MKMERNWRRPAKRSLAALLALILCCLSAACGQAPAHEHAWSQATCQSARVCKDCGETAGSSLGHQWLEASCTQAKICLNCGTVEGYPLEHQPVSGTLNDPITCSRCGEVLGVRDPGSPVSFRDIVWDTWASSVYERDLQQHEPENLFDMDLGTNWTEDASGAGIGEYVGLQFDREYALKGMRISIGSHYSPASYEKNCRPRVLLLTFRGSQGSETLRVTLTDTMDEQVITFDRYYYAETLTVTIEGVYSGTQYEDTIIAELSFEAFWP